METLPRELWTPIADRLDGVDAAAFACASRAARAAHRASRAFRSVRVARDGTVLEPASGTYDVEVAPGEPVAGALARCPRGGSVLLLPGDHGFPALRPDDEVHVFGRAAATVRTPLECAARTATFEGVRFVSPADVSAGGVRFQDCAFKVDVIDAGIVVRDGAHPTFIGCHVDADEVVVEGPGTRGHFENNLFHDTRVYVGNGAAPRICHNVIRGSQNFGVEVRYATATIVGNAIEVAGTGVNVIGHPPGGPRVIIEGNNIEGGSEGGTGVWLTLAAQADIEDNVMWENTDSIELFEGSFAVVRGNFLRGNGAGNGVAFHTGSGGLVSNNNVAGNRAAVLSRNGADPAIADNLLRDSMFGVLVHNARCAMKRNRTRGVLLPRLARWHLRAGVAALTVLSTVDALSKPRRLCVETAKGGCVWCFCAGVCAYVFSF